MMEESSKEDVVTVQEAPQDALPVHETSPTQPQQSSSPQAVTAPGIYQLQLYLKMVVQQQGLQPGICKRGEQPPQTVNRVADWGTVKKSRTVTSAGNKRDSSTQQRERERENPRSRWAQQRAGVHKIAGTAGRTFTSRFRGVHQTFPTKRWEAQFRRNGKPTSLGCFDKENEAARAYDRMMLWCEIHGAGGNVKGSVTNFDLTEYEKDIAWLTGITQDDLIEALRSEGRRQAMNRQAAALNAKRTADLTVGSRSGATLSDADMGGDGGDTAEGGGDTTAGPPPPACGDAMEMDGGNAAAAAGSAGYGGDEGEVGGPGAGGGAVVDASGIFFGAHNGVGVVDADMNSLAAAHASALAVAAAAAAAGGGGGGVADAAAAALFDPAAAQLLQDAHAAAAVAAAAGHALLDQGVTLDDLQQQQQQPGALQLPGASSAGNNNPLASPDAASAAAAAAAFLASASPAGASPAAMNLLFGSIGQEAIAAVQQLQQQLDQAAASGGRPDADAAAAAAFQIGQIAGSNLLAALSCNPSPADGAGAAAAAAGAGVPLPFGVVAGGGGGSSNDALAAFGLDDAAAAALAAVGGEDMTVGLQQPDA